MIEMKFKGNEEMIGKVEAIENSTTTTGVDNGCEFAAHTEFPCTFHGAC